ncbi:MAG: hypothetical protein AB7L71_02050 [Vicinamibacterales bacterium]
MLKRQRNVYLAGVGVALLAIAGLNLLVDPFWVYNTVNASGFNREKVTLHNYLYLHKAHAVYRRPSDKVILGASGAGVGLNPEHPGWGVRAGYNLGLPGAGIREIRLYFEHFHRHRPLTTMVLAVDFAGFNAHRGVKPGYSEERLRSSSWLGHWSTRIHDLMPTLLSASAFNQSVYNLRRNLIVTDETFTRFMANGQAEWTYHRQLVPENGGAASLMLSVEKNFISSVWFPAPAKAFAFEFGGSSMFTEYRELLETAYRDGIETYIVINPSHANLLEALDAAGLWNRFEEWKRQLVGINELVAGQGQRMPFPVWDFAGYNSLTTEPVPGDPETLMAWFWESVHYRPELGQLVLDKIFHHRDPQRVVPDDFGSLIDLRNIDASLAQVRTKKGQYRLEHRPYFAGLSDFAASQLPSRPSQQK